MNIILTGYMGCGKTVIGYRISQKLGMKFIDLDEYIEKKEGSSITKIFEKKGNIYFPKNRIKIFTSSHKRGTTLFYLLGEGTPCYNENSRIFNSYKNISFYLKYSRKNLSKRLFAIKKNRP